MKGFLEKFARVWRRETLVPLVVCTFQELRSSTDFERYEEFCQELKEFYSDQPGIHPLDVSGHQLVEIIRSSVKLRKLLSLIVHSRVRRHKYISVRELPLIRRIVPLWPLLLQYPSPRSVESYSFSVSLIVPCYNESPDEVKRIISCNLKNANRPQDVQVVLVIAGNDHGDFHFDELQTGTSAHAPGELILAYFAGDSGRGLALNYGAEQASGWAVAFCHADTLLPAQWDSSILSSLLERDPITSLGAFRFGIDLSREGLKGQKVPLGLRLVPLGVSLRCKFFSLPYGDQCLFLTSSIFSYVGGFGHQVFMDDYDFVQHFRRRMNCCRSIGIPRERVSVFNDKIAHCSPRRWQQHGVLYSTLLNVFIIIIHHLSATTPDVLNRIYYGKHR